MAWQWWESNKSFSPGLPLIQMAILSFKKLLSSVTLWQWHWTHSVSDVFLISVFDIMCFWYSFIFTNTLCWCVGDLILVKETAVYLLYVPKWPQHWYICLFLVKSLDKNGQRCCLTSACTIIWKTADTTVGLYGIFHLFCNGHSNDRLYCFPTSYLNYTAHLNQYDMKSQVCTFEKPHICWNRPCA